MSPVIDLRDEARRGEARQFDVIVVGAGPAGSTVANLIAERTDKSVLLLEAGPDLSQAEDAQEDPTISPDLFVARSSSDHVDRSVFAQSVDSTNPTNSYLRGRGIGGCGAINGLLSLPGIPSDYDAWAKAGCDGFSWDDLSPVFTQLGRSLRTTVPAAWGSVDRNLVANTGLRDIAAWQEVGTVRCTLSIDEDGRRLVVLPAPRNNLTLRTHTTVHSLLVDDNQTVHGVRLDDNTEFECTHTILCAGTLASPAILLRSGVQRSGIGRNLHDHVGLTLDLTLENPTSLIHESMPFGTSVSNVVHHTEDWIQILPLNRLGLSEELRHRGALMASPLQATHGRGRLTLNENGHVNVTMPKERDERDRVALRKAAIALAAIGQHFDGDVRLEDPQTSRELLQMNESDLDGWIVGHPGSYFHAAGTCRMGSASHDDAVVDPSCAVIGYIGLSVMDASIIPTLPTAGPYLPVMAIATLAAYRFADRLSA